ncbi:site-specific integrase [Klebsiella variicola]|uniref:site-specific integrase n=1 Tax=Klebsiella variicola TaxID=244366 RepID=UPI002FF7D323
MKSNRYLTSDKYGGFYVRITIPGYMRHLFGGKRNFVKSTGTHDIREARIFRDAIFVEWSQLLEEVKPRKLGKMESVLQEIRRTRVMARDTPIPAAPPAGESSCPSLLNMLEIYILQFSEKRKLTTLSKTQKAVEVLLSHMKKRDVQLRDINRTLITGWLEVLKKDKAPSTIQNYVSAMAVIWDLAKNRYHDAPQDNPWRGHGLEAKSSKISYEVFTNTELLKILKTFSDSPEMQTVTMIGMYSGMRLNEICSLRVNNIVEVEGILCFKIEEGKTKASARIVPVHSRIIDTVLRLCEKPHNGFLFYRASIIDRADGKRSTWHTQRFTRAKRKALGEIGTERKVFHSLRHGVVQQLDKNQVPEDRIALIVGHERGNTESFKTYSKRGNPKELMKYIEMLSYPEIEKGA